MLFAGQQPDREGGAAHARQLAQVPQLAQDQPGADGGDYQLRHDNDHDGGADLELLVGQTLLQADRAEAVDQPGGQGHAERLPGEPLGVAHEQWDEHQQGDAGDHEAGLHAGQSGQAHQDWPEAKAQAGEEGEVHVGAPVEWRGG